MAADGVGDASMSMAVASSAARAVAMVASCTVQRPALAVDVDVIFLPEP